MELTTPDACMRRALALAEQARLICSPNPAVGCVLVDAAGQLLGEGHTQAVGQAHAEVMALRDAESRGNNPTGCTAYVTLEPCAHHGKTPPCAEALIKAGVSRVVRMTVEPVRCMRRDASQSTREKSVVSL